MKAWGLVLVVAGAALMIYSFPFVTWSDLYVMNADGSDVTQLTDFRSSELEPAFLASAA